MKSSLLCKQIFFRFQMSRTLQNVLMHIEIDTSPWQYVGKQRLNSIALTGYLKRIAASGPRRQDFYIKNTKDNNFLMRELRQINSSLQQEDITNYIVQNNPAQSIDCLDFKVYTSQLPGSGYLQLFACKILETAINDLGYLHWRAHERFLFNLRVLHYMHSLRPFLKYLEAMYHRERLYHKKRGLRTPFISTRRRILTEETKAIAAYIVHHLYYAFPNTSLSVFGTVSLPRNQISFPKERGTSNICISDKKSNLCATSTINWSFGTKISSNRFGFFYNNQLADFTYKNSRSLNRPQPNTYPQSSIAPTIFTNKQNGRLEFALGAAGGPKIISSIFFVMADMITQREMAKKKYVGKHKKLPPRNWSAPYKCAHAVAIPRCVFHMQPMTKQEGAYTFLECENTLSVIFKNALKKQGTVVRYNLEAGYSAVTIIKQNGSGCHDPRRGGSSKGMTSKKRKKP